MSKLEIFLDENETFKVKCQNSDGKFLICESRMGFNPLDKDSLFFFGGDTELSQWHTNEFGLVLELNDRVKLYGEKFVVGGQINALALSATWTSTRKWLDGSSVGEIAQVFLVQLSPEEQEYADNLIKSGRTLAKEDVRK